MNGLCGGPPIPKSHLVTNKLPPRAAAAFESEVCELLRPPHIIFEFIGGAWDGMNLSNRSNDSIEASLAAYVAKATVDGSIGMSVTMPEQYAIKEGDCTYAVIHRINVNEESLVRLECNQKDDKEPLVPPAKAVLFRFRGGCLHGASLRSDAPDVHQALIAMTYYGLTGQGAVGSILEVTPCLCSRIGGLSSAEQPISYQVAERVEEGTAITVILDHRST